MGLRAAGDDQEPIVNIAATDKHELEDKSCSSYDTQLPAQECQQRRLFFNAIARSVSRDLMHTALPDEEASADELLVSSLQLDKRYFGHRDRQIRKVVGNDDPVL